jgi:oligopeptide transport system ATP-binding protein
MEDQCPSDYPQENLLTERLLEIRDLSTHFSLRQGVVKAVCNVSLNIAHGEVVGLIGESGCGKSVTGLSIMRLIREPGKIVNGQVLFQGKDLLTLNNKEMGQIRGAQISMIFQEPMTSLNPVLTCGYQISEVLKLHLYLSSSEAKKRAVELIDLVNIPDPSVRYHYYPHHFSGGMRQRIMIAMALSCKPKLLIADEPTTALDVTIQAQVLDLIKNLAVQLETAVLLISHNLGVIARYVNRAYVMYAGHIVEASNSRDLYECPKHPYTIGLMASVPRVDTPPKQKLTTIEGLPPDMLSVPPGCAFNPRCKFAISLCYKEMPPLLQVERDHYVACWLTHGGQETNQCSVTSY